MEQVTKKTPRKKPAPKETSENVSTTIPMKAIGMFRDKDGWRNVELTIEGDKVVDSVISEFMNKAICFEDLKIKVVKNFLKEG